MKQTDKNQTCGRRGSQYISQIARNNIMERNICKCQLNRRRLSDNEQENFNKNMMEIKLKAVRQAFSFSLWDVFK
jgi:hypothetical protein